MNYKNHIITSDISIKETMIRMDGLGVDAVLFIQDDQKKLQGVVTDGDIRRGLLNGAILEDPIVKICNRNPEYVVFGEQNIKKLKEQRE